MGHFRVGWRLACILFRDLRTFLAGLREPNCNGLLLALYGAPLGTFSRTELAALLAVHRTLDALACRFSIFRHGLVPFHLWYARLAEVAGFGGGDDPRVAASAILRPRL